jgi:hypothetical protein
MRTTPVLSGGTLVMLALGVALWGCGEAVPDPHPTTGGALSQQGEPCGGFVMDPKQCAEGLTCVASGVPDTGGTCQPSGADGGTGADQTCPEQVSCGVVGKRWDSTVCNCVDGGGTAQEGERCGGNFTPAPVCADGLHCQLDGVPDTGGTCVRD